MQGSKNAVLPILASTILIAGKTTLRNCPDISDVDCMCRILQKIGATVTKKGHEICVDASGALQSRLPAEEVVRMRSSIVLTGALLGRLGQASFCDPGGCVIGDRPIDLHLKAFARFGCQIRREDDNFLTVFAKRLNGVQIPFPFSSVGATQNAILCAVCAKGETVLTGCAKEPEVVSLCRFLNGAGAKIEGAGSKTIRIEGVKKLCSTEFSIDADRIVAGTCLIGVLAAGGEAFLRQAPIGQLTAVIAVAQKMGAQIVPDSEGLLVKRAGRLVSPLLLETDVYPGYPTDLQSPMLTALCCAEGNCMVSERVFNGRFGVHEQLNRMGAAIVAGQTSAEVTGGRKLHGELVFAKELQVSEETMYRALVISNLATIHIKEGIGRLSAYCGAVGAGCGCGAGIAYLYGDGKKEGEHAIVNGLAIVSGMICDGAKASCAAKIASSVDAGILGYFMYKNGQQFIGGDGIVKKGVENTIRCVGKLASEGMLETDREIVHLMIHG